MLEWPFPLCNFEGVNGVGHSIPAKVNGEWIGTGYKAAPFEGESRRDRWIGTSIDGIGMSANAILLSYSRRNLLLKRGIIVPFIYSLPIFYHTPCYRQSTGAYSDSFPVELPLLMAPLEEWPFPLGNKISLCPLPMRGAPFC